MLQTMFVEGSQLLLARVRLDNIKMYGLYL